MIRLNQIEPFSIGSGEKLKRLEVTVNPLMSQEGTNTLIVELTTNLNNTDAVKWLDIYENGVKFIEGVSCTSINYLVGGDKISITVTDTESQISNNDKISVFIVTSQENAEISM